VYRTKLTMTPLANEISFPDLSVALSPHLESSNDNMSLSSLAVACGYTLHLGIDKGWVCCYDRRWKEATRDRERSVEECRKCERVAVIKASYNGIHVIRTLDERVLSFHSHTSSYDAVAVTGNRCSWQRLKSILPGNLADAQNVSRWLYSI
jgi:hypothetical protein